MSTGRRHTQMYAPPQHDRPKAVLQVKKAMLSLPQSLWHVSTTGGHLPITNGVKALKATEYAAILQGRSY